MARYDQSRRGGGSILAWVAGLFLAGLFTIGVVALSRMGAEAVCDGACVPLAGLSEFLHQPFPVMGDTLIWAMALAIILGVFLWIAFGTGSFGLGIIVVLALALIGASLAGDSGEGQILDEEAEVDPIINNDPETDPEPTFAPETDPEPDMVPDIDPEPMNEELAFSPAEPAIPQCPEGNFWNGEGCSACSVTRSVAATPKLAFHPARTQATWGYAAADSFSTASGGGEQPILDFSLHTELAPDAGPLCTNDAVLVIGSASSDGPLERNLDRARIRAEQLASQVDGACNGQVDVFAISLGQSTAERDNFKDRALTVIGLDSLGAEPVTQALIETELGYLIKEGDHSSALLSRASYFPQADWSWVEGGTGRVRPASGQRPVETVTELRPGAPASCQAL